MNKLKVDTNRNNTIIEISGADFLDLEPHEIQVESNHNFPTSQPLIFYRWNGTDVEVNSEETVRLYAEEEGSLLGLDLEPHIETVMGADFTPNGTKEIIVTGINFSPFSEVEITGENNFINTMYFDTPKQIRLSVTASGTEGIYNLIIKNADLHSQESGFNTISVKNKNEIDLRTTPILDMGLEMTSGINVEQDVTKGLRFTSSTSSWNRGVKFSSYFWNRNDEVTYEIIFTRTADVNFMIGIGSSSLDVSSISAAYYAQEIGMYHNNNRVTSMYGGGDVTNWSQNIGTTINFTANEYYKLKLENSGGGGATCSLWEVDPDNWDDESELYSWISDCPADDVILVPFLIPQAATGSYYITGIRY